MGNILSVLRKKIFHKIPTSIFGILVVLLALLFDCRGQWQAVEAYSTIAYSEKEESDQENLVKVTNIQPEKKKKATQVKPENSELFGDTLAGVASETYMAQKKWFGKKPLRSKTTMEWMDWKEASIFEAEPTSEQSSQVEEEQVQQQNLDALAEQKWEKKVEKKISETNRIKIHLSKKDKAVLLRIVEAEATDEDVKGRMLVANVVLNRVKCKTEFPDNVTDVVFDKTGGVYQFSPIQDGRYWSVSISEKTKTAVERVLQGEDCSKGALYFMARKYADSDNVVWFDNSLTWLFAHGQHEFFK